MTIENVISNYRILTQLFRNPSSVCYLAEDTTGTAPLAIITLWPIITLTESATQSEFLQKARGGSIQSQGKTIAIRDAGLREQHPYIITSSSYEIRDLLERQLKILDQILLKMQKNYPGDQRVLLNTLLYAFITPAPLDEQRSFPPPVPNIPAPVTPAPIEDKPLVSPAPETPAPAPVEDNLEDEVFVFPIQEAFIPTMRSASSITSEPTLFSANTASQEVENAASLDEPTVRSTKNMFQEEAQEATLPPSVPLEPTQRSANPVSQVPNPVSQVPINEGWRIPTNVSPQEQPLPLGAPIGTLMPKGWRPNKWQIGVAAVLVLLLLAWGINTLHTTLPATTATITIKPMSKEIRKTYSVSVNAQASSDPLVVQGRTLAASSQQLVQTVAATGQGHHDAVSATGTIVVSQINLTSSTGNDMLNLSIGDNNGITANADESVHIYTGATVSIPCHATPAGSAGNIAAHDMDGPIQIIDHLTRAVIGTAYISNPQPFTGGVDARDYTYVQQSDIDKAANGLVAQLTPETKAKVKQQVKKGEMIDHDPSCSQSISSDHHAQDEAASVTVKVNVRCNALAFPDHALQDAAQKAYTKDGNTQFGNGYGVVGSMVVSKPEFMSNSSDSFSVTVDGIWSFQYTSQSQQDLKKSIAGKPSNDALQVLKSRKDIQSVTLTTNGGFGTAVPTAADKIKLIIGTVNGLHA